MKIRTLKTVSILLLIILLPGAKVLAQAENKDTADTAGKNIEAAEITADPAPDPCSRVLRWLEREQKINDSLQYVIAMERTQHEAEVDSLRIANLNLLSAIEKQKSEKQTAEPKEVPSKGAGADPLLSELKQKNSALTAEKDALNKRINTVEKEKDDLQKKAASAENKRAETDSLFAVCLVSQVR